MDIGRVAEEQEAFELPGLAPEPQPLPTGGVARVMVFAKATPAAGEYEYLIPPEMADDVVVGRLVRIRFGGHLVDGYVLKTYNRPTYRGRLRSIERVITTYQPLHPGVYSAAEQIAAQYGATPLDVVRLAVPARHAGEERAFLATDPANHPVVTAHTPGALGPRPVWDDAHAYAAWSAFKHRCNELLGPIAHVPALAGSDVKACPAWAQTLVGMTFDVLATRYADNEPGQVVIVCPDDRAAELMTVTMTRHIPETEVAVLQSSHGPRQRYQEFLRTLFGQVRVVIGTRSAVWAPAPELVALFVVDPDEHGMQEPRFPYPRLVDIAVARGRATGAGVLFLERTPSPAVRIMHQRGLIRDLGVDPEYQARQLPRADIAGTSDDDLLTGQVALSPTVVAAVRGAVQRGPVLVQMPRNRQAPAVRCGGCSARVLCRECGTALRCPGSVATPQCPRCLHVAHSWQCSECKSHEWVMRADGATRTIHEIGRLVPGASLVVATAQQRSVRHPGGPGMLVVATPGAEPVVSGGYALSLLLDGHQLWDRSDDDADASAIRCWSRVALLTQPAYKGGQLIFARNDPQGLSEVVCAGQQAAWTDAMLAERAELGLPPAVPSATVSGAWSVVVTFLDSWRKRHTGTPLRVLGPIKGETATAMVVPEPGTDDTGLQHWLDVAVDHVKHLRQERVVRGLPVPTVVIAPA